MNLKWAVGQVEALKLFMMMVVANKLIINSRTWMLFQHKCKWVNSKIKIKLSLNNRIRKWFQFRCRCRWQTLIQLIKIRTLLLIKLTSHLLIQTNKWIWIWFRLKCRWMNEWITNIKSNFKYKCYIFYIYKIKIKLFTSILLSYIL